MARPQAPPGRGAGGSDSRFQRRDSSVAAGRGLPGGTSSSAGSTLSRHGPGFFAAFMATAAELGFSPMVAQAQRPMVGQICALRGLAPQRLSLADIFRK